MQLAGVMWVAPNERKVLSRQALHGMSANRKHTHTASWTRQSGVRGVYVQFVHAVCWCRPALPRSQPQGQKLRVCGAGNPAECSMCKPG
jgi:hypothetical protein